LGLAAIVASRTWAATESRGILSGAHFKKVRGAKLVSIEHTGVKCAMETRADKACAVLFQHYRKSRIWGPAAVTASALRRELG
jgi:hypothetical protein